MPQINRVCGGGVTLKNVMNCTIHVYIKIKKNHAILNLKHKNFLEVSTTTTEKIKHVKSFFNHLKLKRTYSVETVSDSCTGLP